MEARVLCGPLLFVQFPNPNIAKTQRISVILQLQRSLFRTWLVSRALAMSGRPGEFDIVLHQHAIVQQRNASRMM